MRGPAAVGRIAALEISAALTDGWPPGACGVRCVVCNSCVCVVCAIKDISKEEWLSEMSLSLIKKTLNIDKIYGLAYGISELDFAKNTIHLAETQFKNINNFNMINIDNFINSLKF